MALYNIIDTFWVARLGHEPIAALTVILPYSIIIMAVGVGTGVGAALKQAGQLSGIPGAGRRTQ